jgi:hypothetical protein
VSVLVTRPPIFFENFDDALEQLEGENTTPPIPILDK